MNANANRQYGNVNTVQPLIPLIRRKSPVAAPVLASLRPGVLALKMVREQTARSWFLTQRRQDARGVEAVEVTDKLHEEVSAGVAPRCVWEFIRA